MLEIGQLVGFLIPFALGLIATMTAFLAERYFSKRDRRLEREERMLEGAWGGLGKLVYMNNCLGSLRMSLDEHIDDANKNGFSDLEFCQKIPNNFVFHYRLEVLGFSETKFLFSSASGRLVTDLQVAEMRFETTMRFSDQVFAHRSELANTFEEHLDANTSVTGTTASSTFEGVQAQSVSIKLGVLNKALWELMEKLKEDEVALMSLIDEYVRLAKLRFGNRFPDFERSELSSC